MARRGGADFTAQGLRTVAEGWKGSSLMKTLKRSNFLVGSFEAAHAPAAALLSSKLLPSSYVKGPYD